MNVEILLAKLLSFSCSLQNNIHCSGGKSKVLRLSPLKDIGTACFLTTVPIIFHQNHHQQKVLNDFEFVFAV